METLIKARDKLERAVRDKEGATMEDLSALQMLIQNVMTRSSTVSIEPSEAQAWLEVAETRKPVPDGSGMQRVNAIFAKHSMNAPAPKISVQFEIYMASLENDSFVFAAESSGSLAVALDKLYKQFNESYSSLSGLWECSKRVPSVICAEKWRELALKTKPFVITRCLDVAHMLERVPLGTREWVIHSSGPTEVTGVSCCHYCDWEDRREGCIWYLEGLSMDMEELGSLLTKIKEVAKVPATIHCEQNLFAVLEKSAGDMPIIWTRVLLKKLGFGGQASIPTVHKFLYGLERSIFQYSSMSARDRFLSELAAEHYMLNNILCFARGVSQMGIKLNLGSQRTYQVAAGMLAGDWLVSERGTGRRTMDESQRLFYIKRRADERTQ